MHRALFGIALLLSAACGTGTLYHHNSEIADNVWERSDVRRFEVPITDTVSSYDIYLEVRNAGSYPFSNLYLFIDTEMPSGLKRRDTVECLLADPTGRWLGEGLGDIWDNSILYRPATRFPKLGTYVFTIGHGMRNEKLPMIMDIGMAIRPATKH